MSELELLIKEQFEKVLVNNKYDTKVNYSITKNKSIANGHYSTNYSLLISKIIKSNPIDIANQLVLLLSKKNDIFEKVEFAKPGFINFWLNKKIISKFMYDSLSKGMDFAKEKNKEYYNLEIVSANPTGWLHIGHARNGVVGDCFARILKHLGHKVKVEYYTNDAGNQINICAITIFYHYQKLQGIDIKQPEEIYGGDMYIDVANLFVKKYKNKFIKHKIDYENNKIDDDEVHVLFRTEAVAMFLNEIKKQLIDAKINIDFFSSEKKMYEDKEIEKLLKLYKEKKAMYEKDGALWLETTKFGDDKDRVLLKSDKTYTYLVPDLAAHNLRFRRENADKYFNFWGGDHHGYVPRLKAGLTMLGYKPDILDVEMIQMVRLIKDGSELKISKRKGTAVWMQDVIEMIGLDSLRYMLNSKSASSHLDFDLDLLNQQNASNPVYYVQYCTARCNQVLDKYKKEINIKSFELLNNEKELDIIFYIDQFKNILRSSRDNCQPNMICDYSYNLSKLFHSYYADTKIISDDVKLTEQRISLVKLVSNVIKICLNLIGVEIKAKM